MLLKLGFQPWNNVFKQKSYLETQCANLELLNLKLRWREQPLPLIPTKVRRPGAASTGTASIRKWPALQELFCWMIKHLNFLEPLVCLLLLPSQSEMPGDLIWGPAIYDDTGSLSFSFSQRSCFEVSLLLSLAISNCYYNLCHINTSALLCSSMSQGTQDLDYTSSSTARRKPSFINWHQPVTLHVSYKVQAALQSEHMLMFCNVKCLGYNCAAG